MVPIGWDRSYIIALAVVVLSSSCCGVMRPYLLWRNLRMVGTIGVICPVMGLRRAARYLLSMASMICLMKVCLRSRVSK